MPQTQLPDANEPTDEACMLALQQGDDAALAPLMRRWELPVKAFIARLGVTPADVEDVAQDTFVRLYTKRTHFRPGAAFKPWVLTLAGNLARNRLRWRFRRREHSLDALTAEGTSSSTGESTSRFDPADTGTPSPADATESASLRRLVRAAVDALPDKLRGAVVCVELEDLSYQEAAQVLGCTTKGVETRLYRARQLLREAFKGHLAQGT